MGPETKQNLVMNAIQFFERNLTGVLFVTPKVSFLTPTLIFLTFVLVFLLVSLVSAPSMVSGYTVGSEKHPVG